MAEGVWQGGRGQEGTTGLPMMFDLNRTVDYAKYIESTSSTTKVLTINVYMTARYRRNLGGGRKKGQPSLQVFHVKGAATVSFFPILPIPVVKSYGRIYILLLTKNIKK